jgi:prepilin-type N-terminal cleavage/methylation domain-containing protein
VGNSNTAPRSPAGETASSGPLRNEGRPGPSSSAALALKPTTEARRRSTRGVTLIEFLVVIAIIGVLAGIGFVRLQPPSVRLMANDYRAMLQQARFEAIKRNRPVMVVWDAGQGQFISRVKDTSEEADCNVASSTQLRVKRVDEYPNVQVSSVTGTGTGIVWLPSGMARNCDATSANPLDVSGTVTFSKVGGGTSIPVSISPSGRVRIGTP